MDGRRGDTQAKFFRFLFHAQKKRKKNAGKTGCFYRLATYRRPDAIAMPREKLRRGGRSIRTAQPLDRDSSGISIADIKNVNLFKYKYPLK